MFEYDNTLVLNVNMIVTMENIVAEENIILIRHCLYIQGRQRLHITTNDDHQLFLVSWILNIYICVIHTLYRRKLCNIITV